MDRRVVGLAMAATLAGAGLARANGDTNGPWVVSHTPASLPSSAASLAAVDLTFSEPLNPASVSTQSARLIFPNGITSTAHTVALVPGSSNELVRVSLTNGFLRGAYRIEAGPGITDEAGNPMDQNRNGIAGEPGDVYRGSVSYAQTLWTPPNPAPGLFVEGFDIWTNRVPDHWAFTVSTPGDTIQPSTNGAPRTGSRHLHFRGSGTQEATLAVDLSTAGPLASLYLTISVKRASTAGVFRVSISDNGSSWNEIYAVDPPPTYTDYPWDLIRQGRYPPTLYVRLSNDGGGTNQEAFVDDVAIVTQLPGLRVLEHTPTSLAATSAPLGELVVAFSDPVDTNSLAAGDVMLRTPLGDTVSATAVTAIAGSTNRRFAVAFPAQNIRGTYRLTVGPFIHDLAGSPMNQDGDIPRGEDPQDAYSSALTFAGTTWGPPAAEDTLYTEGFDVWPPVPAHWAFSPSTAGAVGPVASGTPHSGTGHLRFVHNSGSTYTTDSATLAVDLSTVAAWNNVTLRFWLRKESTYGDFRVQVSGDGATWRQVLSTDPPTTYSAYTVDLDAEAAAGGFALDGDVYVRFQDYGVSTYKAYLDDVRITAPSPVVTIASLDAFADIRLSSTAAAGWRPEPWYATNLAGPWLPVPSYTSSYPTATGGVFLIRCPWPADTGAAYFRVLSHHE